MTHDRFLALVARAEQQAARDPASYRRRLGLLAAFGYAYLLVMLVVLLAAIGLLVYAFVTAGRTSGRLALWLVVLVGLIARSLWVTVPRPEGLPLTAADAPGLFAMLEEVRAALRAPRLHHVVLTDDFNAAAFQVPRFGLFGGDRNWLVLGLPLLEALSPEQFRAVVAHEVGHFSERHGRFGLWIWRVRRTWEQLFEQLQESGQRGAFLFTWFVRWYAPRLTAYSYAEARIGEQEADRYEVELVGPETAATALGAMAVYAAFLEKAFWPRVYREANQRPQPPEGVLPELLQELRRPPDNAEQWLREAIAQDADFSETHPSVESRLSAMGYEGLRADPARQRALLPGPLSESAAARYLGARRMEYAGQLDAWWRREVAEGWSAHHAEARQAEQRIQELAARAEQAPLSQEEAWERARLTTDFGETAEAVPLLEDMAARWPSFLPAQFALGMLLLEQDDARGVALVHAAMDAERDFAEPGCAAVCQFLRRQGRNQEAEAYLRRALAHSEASEEELVFRKQDALLPHAVPAELVGRVCECLRQVEGVKAGYLFCRGLRALPGQTSTVLGLDPGLGFWQLRDTSAQQNAALQRALELVGPVYPSVVVVLMSGPNDFLLPKAKRVPGARIYERHT